MNALLVFVKYPEAGKVKTRLCPPLQPDQACDLYKAMMLDSIEIYLRQPAVTVLPQIDPAYRRADFEKMFEWDLTLVDQSQGDLGCRMEEAFRLAFGAGAQNVLAIGTDHPSLPPGRILEALDGLKTHDLVLGPAQDGGYYLIGMKELYSDLFREMTWSVPSVLALTVEKASKIGLSMFQLESWYDVDQAADLTRLEKDLKNNPKQAPRTLAWFSKQSSGA